MLLERLEMENFKSFRGRHEIAFGPKLNCITGANGSGKSNILEAICFAFGESSCARLRVASMKELHSKSLDKNEETTTRVTLHLRTRQNEAMVVSASMCARTGHRTYKLNNRVTPIKMVKRQLRLLCGINVDVSLWFIQQNFVHKMPSRTPVELASFLCEAAGTKLFFEYREEAHTAIQDFKKSALTIDQNIWRLNEVVRRESILLDTYKQQRENDQLINTLTEQIRQTNYSLLHSKFQRVGEDLGALNDEANEVSARLESAKTAHDQQMEDIRQLDTWLSAFRSEQPKYERVKLQLISLTTTLEGIASRSAQLREQISSESIKQRELEREIVSISTKKTQTELALSEVSARLTSTQKLQLLYSNAVSCRSSPEQFTELLRQELTEVENEGIDQDGEVLRNKLEQLSTLENELCEKLSSMKKEIGVAEEQLSRDSEEIVRLRMEINGRSKDQVDTGKAELRSRLNIVCEEERATLIHVPTLSVPPQGEGDFGLLRDYFEVKVDEAQEGGWIRPLGLLLQKALSIRICADSDVAKRILSANRNRHSFTIWPVKELRMSPRKLESCLPSVYRAFGRADAVDPMELISINHTGWSELNNHLGICLRKALGQWLLVRSDNVGQEVLHRFGIPCVTVNLNMHSPGILSGGYQGDNAAFNAFLKLPSYRARRSQLEGELERLKSIQLKLHSLDDLSKQSSKLRDWVGQKESEIDHVRTRLSKLRDQRERMEKEHFSFLNTEVRKEVLKKDLNAFLGTVSENGTIVDPSVWVFQDKKIPDLDEQVCALKVQLSELETTHTRLEAHLEQSNDNQKVMATHLQDLQHQVHCMNEEVAECKIKDSQAKAQETLASQHATALASRKESVRVLEEEIKALECDQKDLALRERELEASFQSLQRDLSGHNGDRRLLTDAGKMLVSVEDLETEVDHLKKQLYSCTLKQRAYQEAISKDGKVSEEAALFKQRQLARFKDQDQTLKKSIRILEEGIRTTQDRSAQANKVAFTNVNRCLSDIFGRVTPGKSVELSVIGTNIEDGVRFDVSSAGSSKATKELSGGQLAMLGMSYVFALARYSASPLYVLDEIDAALDEHNQRRVAELVQEHFNQSQVICISHHEAFHDRALRLIQVHKEDANSSITVRNRQR